MKSLKHPGCLTNLLLLLLICYNLSNLTETKLDKEINYHVTMKKDNVYSMKKIKRGGRNVKNQNVKRSEHQKYLLG